MTGGGGGYLYYGCKQPASVEGAYRLYVARIEEYEMKNANYETKNPAVPFLKGMALAVVLGLMVAWSTSAFAMGGGGGGGGSAPAPKVTKVDSPVTKPKDEAPVGESKTREPEEKVLAIEDPDEDKTETKPDERTVDFPETGDTKDETAEVVEATVGFATSTSSVAENDGHSHLVEVRISDPLLQSVTLHVVAGGTAARGTDYQIVPATLTIPAGNTSASLTLTSIDDDIDESDETVTLTLGGTLPDGVSFGEYVAHAITIVDNDVAAAIGFARRTTQMEEGGEGASLGVVLSRSFSQPVTATLSMGGNTDAFELSPGTVTFRPGETSKVVNLAALEDADSDNESVTIYLSGNFPDGVEYGEIHGHVVTVIDNDPVAPAVVSFGTPRTQMKEGETASLKVLLSKAVPQTVTLTLSEDSNESNIDFSPSTVTFRPGSTEEVVNFTAAEDDDSDDERVTVHLVGSLPAGVRYGEERRGHVVTIIDDDDPAASATVEFVASSSVVAEGEDAHLQVVLSGHLPAPVSLPLRASGTASGSDFSLPSALLISGAGTTSVPLDVLADTVPELEETIVLALAGDSLPSGVSLGANTTHTVTIPANDNTITFATPSSASIAEEGGIATIAATINNPIPASKTASVTVIPHGSAVGGTDYNLSVSGGSLSGNTWTLPAGVSGALLAVTAVDNSVDAEDKTLTLDFAETSLPDGWSIGSSSRAITIVDNDSSPEFVPATVKFTTRESEVKEGDDVELQVELSKPLPQTVTLNVRFQGWRASADDIDSLPGTVTFPEGETTASVNFTVVDDSVFESDERFVIVLRGTDESRPYVRVGSPRRHTVTIEDNDAEVGFRNSHSSGREGDKLLLEVDLSRPRLQPLTLSVSASAGSEDDITIPDSITFEQGEAHKSLEVVIDDDAIFEGSETVILSLGGELPYGVTFDTRDHIVTIRDDGEAIVEFVTSTSSVTEGHGHSHLVEVRISEPLSQEVTLIVSPISGTALWGTDYQIVPATLTIPAGITSWFLTLEAIDDDVDEEDKTIILMLTSFPSLPDGVIFGRHTHTVTIVDDDVAEVEEIPEVVVTPGDETGTETEDKTVNKPDERTIVFPEDKTVEETTDVSVIEFKRTESEMAEGGGKVVLIEAQITPPVSEAIRLDYVYSGSAEQGYRTHEERNDDYRILWHNTFIPANAENVNAVQVLVFDDDRDEGNESFTVTMNESRYYGLPEGVILGEKDSHTVTIVDDDDGIEDYVTVGFAKSTTRFNENVGSIAVEVVLSEALDEPLRVWYGTKPPPLTFEKDGKYHLDRSRRELGNYLHRREVTFQPGETSKSFLFDINDDRLDETFSRYDLVNLSGELPEGVKFGRRTHTLFNLDNDPSNSPVTSHRDGVYHVEYDGNDISLINDGNVVKLEALNYSIEDARITIENSGTVVTDIIGRNHTFGSVGVISIKNGATGEVGGNVIGKHHHEGNILIENRGTIGGDIRAVHFEKGDIVIENTGTVNEDIEATHYGDGDISIANRDYIGYVYVRHLGNGVVRYDGEINNALEIVGDYEGTGDTQLNFHVDSLGNYAGMYVEGDVTGQSRVSLVVDENAVIRENTHFEELIEVYEDYDAEAGSFMGEQVIGAFNYVLEYENYGHVWSFMNKGLSDTAEKSAKIPDDIEKDMGNPPKPKVGPDGKPELGLWGDLDSSRTDIGLGFPAFVSNDDYYVGSQVQYHFKDDRTGIRALVETEYNFDVMNFRITPLARLTWTRVGFEDFVGPHRERISLVDGDTVDLKLGLSFDGEYRFSNGLGYLYGGLFMQTPIDGKTSVKVSGVTIANERNDVSIDGKLGLSYEWNEGYSVYGEASALHRDDADEVRANLGVRIDF